jgi:TIGR03009 family protein
MRSFRLALAAPLLAGTCLFAQPPAAPPAAPAPGRLDALLVRWEQEMKSVQTLVAQCTRIETDQVNLTSEVFIGTAKFMKPSYALLEMHKKDKPEVFEKYLYTGTELYEYRPQIKAVRIHSLPPPNPGEMADDNFLRFVFGGLKAEEARRRYDLRLVKEDQWYVYLEVLPKLPADKVDFQKLRLVLHAKTLLPRELWLQQPNGNEVKWDIPEARAGVPLGPKDFAAPPVPPGWTVMRVPRVNAAAPANELPPRVVRPNGPNP